MQPASPEEIETLERTLESAPALSITPDWLRAHSRYPRSSALAMDFGRLIQVQLLAHGECENEAAFVHAFDVAAESARNMVLRYHLPEGGHRGILYLNAISLLERGWQHGPTLRKWHARTYGV